MSMHDHFHPLDAGLHLAVFGSIPNACEEYLDYSIQLPGLLQEEGIRSSLNIACCIIICILLIVLFVFWIRTDLGLLYKEDE